MKKNSKKEKAKDELRRRAEEKVGKIIGSEVEFLAKDPVKLIHELEVHQIELEMQNEQLRLSQQENEELRALYQVLYDFAPVGYLTLDDRQRILRINLAGAALIGRVKEDIAGHPLVEFIDIESIRVITDCLRRCIETEGPFRSEVRLWSSGKDGKWVIIDGMPFENPDNSARELRLTLTDISERKKMEEMIWELNRDMEKRVQQRTEELREKEQLLLIQSRHAAMGEMIDNIAHQWRQPLNALGMIVQTLPLAREKGELTREYVKDYEKKAMGIIGHMSETINDFRDYFRPDKEKVLFKICKVVDRTMTLVEESFKERLIELNRIKKEEQTIEGYPHELGHVLLNILLNARDAFEMRSTAGRKVTISIGGENGRSVVTILDNAGGIPEPIMDRIFDPYFSTKGQERGSGIGLYMSKTIVEKGMGGKLTVRNVEGGAEFRIEI